jgi:hypothetical protein
MPFSIKKLEDGSFGVYNKTKKEMTKRSFKTKEAAERMASHWDDFAHRRKTAQDIKRKAMTEKATEEDKKS